MRAFCLKKLRVLSNYFGSDLQNFRRTSSSWNLILSSRKLHDASSTAPPVEKLKLRDYASTRQKELTIERKQLWISRADTQQLCESDLKAQISDMLKNIDIRELATSKSISNIFESLDYDVDDISNFIASYAVSIPNLEVEHIIKKIQNLHGVLEFFSASSMYEKLILYCCVKHKVDVAIDVVDKMCEAGFTISSHVMQSVLETCSETDQHSWVFEIYSIISRHPHHFELNGKICRLLVHFCVVMKDFECAYKMVDELQKKYFKYKTTMYNVIMAGYFFEKNISGGLRVLKQMRDANVKLDSYTFSYLIGNSETKEEIKKYYEEMEQSGIHLTKEVFVALLHAYPACGEFDVKKQDVLCNLHGELERLLLILKELSGQDWVDGCRWAIRYSVKHKNLSSTVELFKQLKDYFKSDKFKRHMLFDEAYCLISKYGPTYLQFGLDLLGLIKKELGLVPSRLCLDSLLSGCAKSRDLNNAYLVWREYEFAGYRYDSISYLTMYHALLASGDHKYADIILKKIPRLYFDLCSSLKHSYVKVDEAGKAKASYYKAVNERKGRGHFRGKPYGKDKGKKKDVGGGSKPM